MTETAQRGGHIPGAVNVPWSKAVNDDGTFKAYDELVALYEAQGRATRRQGSGGLLPHRRAQFPHLVCPQIPSGLRKGPQLRRKLDGMGQPDRSSHRKRQSNVTGGRAQTQNSTCIFSKGRMGGIILDRRKFLETTLLVRPFRECPTAWQLPRPSQVATAISSMGRAAGFSEHPLWKKSSP